MRPAALDSLSWNETLPPFHFVIKIALHVQGNICTQSTHQHALPAEHMRSAPALCCC